MKLKDAKLLATRLTGNRRFSGLDISISIPGHPVDGSELYCQPDGGAYMVFITKENMRVFLWESSVGHYQVRDWCVIGQLAPAKECDSLVSAIQYVLEGIPPTKSADDFDDIKRDFLHPNSRK